MNTKNLKPWGPGQSGNPRGRPASGLALAELARELVSKHDLVGKLARIAARAGRSKVGVDQQLRAIQLLLAYAYGPPKTEIALEHSGTIEPEREFERLKNCVVGVLEGFAWEDGVRQKVARALIELEKLEEEPPALETLRNRVARIAERQQATSEQPGSLRDDSGTKHGAN